MIDALCTDPDGNYVDATFGRGGHTRALLRAFVARRHEFSRSTATRPRSLRATHSPTSDARVLRAPRSHERDATGFASDAELSEVVGVLMDLGVSSPQLDDPERGMSFRGDGPLDMRMDPTRGYSGVAVDQQRKRRRTRYVFREFGEERHARRIARAIVERRARSADPAHGRTGRVGRTARSRDPIRTNMPRRACFRRSEFIINDELEEVRLAIEAAFELIRPADGSRC